MNLFIKILASIIIWFEDIKENCVVYKFAFNFLKVCCGDNYQEATQLGQTIRYKYNPEDVVYLVVKDSMEDVLSDGLYCDNMKIMAIKVLAGLKSD